MREPRLFPAARAAAADFIPLMVSLLTGLFTPTLTGLRRAVRRGLVPAEAIARRMIWMLAGELAKAAPAPKARHTATPARPSSAPKPSTRKPRTYRALRLTELQPRPGAGSRLPPRRAATPAPRPPADPAALLAKAARAKTPPFTPGAPMVPDHPTVPRDFVLRLGAAAIAAWRRLTPNTS